MTGLTNALIDVGRLEALIVGGFALGVGLLTVHRLLRSTASPGTRWAKVLVELQRKSFHMVGGCLICSAYHWGVKRGHLAPAFQQQGASGADAPLDAGIALLACCFVSWLLEASRLTIPAVQRWYLESFKGLVREKEFNKAAGIAYFLPGALAAMLAAPSNVAILGILFLSVGDAAASIGTAAGSIPVGKSNRKVEGSIGCFVVCTLLGAFAGLPTSVALTASALASLGEVLAEVIGLDDNFVIPLLGVLGVRFGLNPQLLPALAVMGFTLGVGVLLGAVVASTTTRKS